jgi:hypothetical protein
MSVLVFDCGNRIIKAKLGSIRQKLLPGGLEHIFHTKRNVDLMVHLGYPLYFLYIIGVWKILRVRNAGVSAILKARRRNRQIGNRKVKHLGIPYYV